MRTTKQIISIIQDYMDNVPVDRVREYLSRSYLGLINSNSSQNVFYIDNEQPLPILKTTTGDRKYAISAANLVDADDVQIVLEQDGITVSARKVRSLFIEKTGLQGRSYRLNDYVPVGVPSNYFNWYKERSFSKVPFQSYNQRGSQPATVILFDDYDTDIYVEFYYTPGDLLTNLDEMLIDTDDWTDALVDGAVGYYEDLINGESKRLDKYNSYWKRKYLNVGMDNLGDKVPNQFKARPLG